MLEIIHTKDAEFESLRTADGITKFAKHNRYTRRPVPFYISLKDDVNIHFNAQDMFLDRLLVLMGKLEHVRSAQVQDKAHAHAFYQERMVEIRKHDFEGTLKRAKQQRNLLSEPPCQELNDFFERVEAFNRAIAQQGYELATKPTKRVLPDAWRTVGRNMLSGLKKFSDEIHGTEQTAPQPLIVSLARLLFHRHLRP